MPTPADPAQRLSTLLRRARCVLGSHLAVIFASTALWPVWALAADPVQAQTLNGEVRSLVEKNRLPGAKIGVVMKDITTGTTLISINAEDPLIPASNMKLLTSGAAISVLGPSFSFNTEFILDNTRLIVKGSGDPALGDPELLKEMGVGVEELLSTWTDAVKKAGAGQISEIIADDRVYDREWVHPTWPKDQLNRWYCAEVAGLNFHTNVASIFAKPAAAETAPTISMEPRADWLEVQNRALSKAQGQNTIWGARSSDGGGITLYGNVRWALQEPVDVAVVQPPMYLGRLLADRLKVAGLGAPRVRLTEGEDGGWNGRTIAVVRSPMEIILRRCNVNSYNLYAEALLKRIGHDVTGQPGSWENGASVLRMTIQERLGPADATAVGIADGSGMSRDNRVSAGVMTRWLENLASDPKVEPALLASLPVAQKDGSLRNRFGGKPLKAEVRAKTGYIRAVSCLSGYITEPTSGRRLAFSILVNDFPAKAGVKGAKDFHEDVVMLGVDWLLKRVSTGESKRGAPVSPQAGGSR